MISRIIRYLFSLAAIALAVLIIRDADNISSLLPAKYNLSELLKTTNTQPKPQVEPQEEITIECEEESSPLEPQDSTNLE